MSNFPAGLKRFLFVFTIGSVFSQLVSYVRINYLNANLLIGQIIASDDKSGVIPDYAYKTQDYKFGSHYFSDFTEALLKTQARAPYTSVPRGLWVSNYPPFGQAILFPFSWTPYRISVLIFLFLMVVAVGSAFWYASRKYDVGSRIAFLIIGVFCSTPVLFFLDRGNYWGFTTALVLWAIIVANRGLWYLAAFLISVAAALKVFPIVLFFWIYKKSDHKAVLFGLTTGAFLTIGSMLLFKGSPIENFLEFIRAQSIVHGNSRGNLSFQHLNSSMLSFLINLKGSSVPVIHEIGRTLVENYFTVVGFLLIVSVGILLKTKPCSQKRFAEITLLIAVINFLPPVVFNYALSLYLVPLLYILLEDSVQQGEPILCTFIGLLFINKVPFEPYNSQQTGSNLVNAFLQFCILTICAFIILKKNDLEIAPPKVTTGI
jgi:hypothetical protein